MQLRNVFTRHHVLAAVAVAVMVVGGVTDSAWTRVWGLLIAIGAVGLYLAQVIRQGVEAVKAYIQKWSHQVFTDGFQAGREAGAAEQFIRETQEPDSVPVSLVPRD